MALSICTIHICVIYVNILNALFCSFPLLMLGYCFLGVCFICKQIPYNINQNVCDVIYHKRCTLNVKYNWGLIANQTCNKLTSKFNPGFRRYNSFFCLKILVNMILVVCFILNKLVKNLANLYSTEFVI